MLKEIRTKAKKEGRKISRKKEEKNKAV